MNLSQLDVILGKVGEIEDEIFRRRKGAEEAEEARRGGATPICKQYRSRGSCVRGASCRFLHDVATGTGMISSGNKTRAHGFSALTDVQSFKPGYDLVMSVHEKKPVQETVVSVIPDKVLESDNVSAAAKLKEDMLRKKRKVEGNNEQIPGLESETNPSVETGMKTSYLIEDFTIMGDSDISLFFFRRWG